MSHVERRAKPMKYRLSLAVTILTGMTILALSACGATSNATDWTFGDSLVIRVKEMRLVKEVRYFDGEKHFLIQPSQEDRTLAAAHLEIRNREANLVYLSVTKDSVKLRDDEYLDYTPIDPFEERQEVAEAGPGEDTIIPFIWDDVELPRTCGEPEMPCELTGWMLFEVPRDIKFYQLIWDATDTIYMRF